MVEIVACFILGAPPCPNIGVRLCGKEEKGLWDVPHARVRCPQWSKGQGPETEEGDPGDSEAHSWPTAWVCVCV